MFKPFSSTEQTGTLSTPVIIVATLSLEDMNTCLGYTAIYWPFPFVMKVGGWHQSGPNVLGIRELFIHLNYLLIIYYLLYLFLLHRDLVFLFK